MKPKFEKILLCAPIVPLVLVLSCAQKERVRGPVGLDGGVVLEVPTDMRLTTYGPVNTLQDAYTALDWRCAAAELERDSYVNSDSTRRDILVFLWLALTTLSTTLAGVAGIGGVSETWAKRLRIAGVLGGGLGLVVGAYLASYHYDDRIDGNRRALARIQIARNVAASNWAVANERERRDLLRSMAQVCLGVAYLENGFADVEQHAFHQQEFDAGTSIDGGQ